MLFDRLHITLQTAFVDLWVVRATGFREDADIPSPLRNKEGIASLASLIVLGAMKREVHRKSLHGRILFRNAVPGSQHPHRSDHITRTTISLVDVRCEP